MPHESIIAPVQLGTFAITAAVTVMAYKHGDRPGGRSFVALMAAFSLLSIVGILMPSHTHWLTSVADTLWSLLPLLWVLFVFNYTGYGHFLNKYTLTALSVIPASSIILVWSFHFYPSILTFIQETGLFLIILGWTLALLGLGILLLLKFALSENRLYTDQSAALIIGMSGLFGAFSSGLLNIRPFGIQPLFPSISILGVAFGFALFRFELFSVLPITKQIGRDAVVEDIQEGIFITNTEGQIVDVNEAGAALVTEAPADLIGGSTRAVFSDQAPSAPDTIAPSVYRTDDGRSYDVTVSEIRDRAERPIGQAVVLRDITDRELRETQLEVLNRVLRHNLRNKLDIVRSHAELLAERGDEQSTHHAKRQLTATNELLSLGERAREFEQLKTREEATAESVDLAAIIESICDELISGFPNADVTVDVPALTIETYPEVLEIVLENLLWNAAEHSDGAPQIEVSASSTDDRVEIVVRDDGPGIPDDELAVLDAGTETALEHGSGLGLWITTWGVQYLGGNLAFENEDEQGTTALVTVPKHLAERTLATSNHSY